MKINILQRDYPMSHVPADAESEALLKEHACWAWIPWPSLGIFEEYLAEKGVELVIKPCPRNPPTKPFKGR